MRTKTKTNCTCSQKPLCAGVIPQWFVSFKMNCFIKSTIRGAGAAGSELNFSPYIASYKLMAHQHL